MKILRICALFATALSALAIDPATKIPSGSKIYVEPMDGFGTYVVAAISNKKVPVKVIADKESADYVIGGAAESQKAGWAKIVFGHSTASTEEASINVTNVKTGEIVFAYNVNKANAVRGKQSAAEACAKHLKDAVGK